MPKARARDREPPRPGGPAPSPGPDPGAEVCHLTTTNLRSGRLRIVELPFALDGARLYALAEPGPLAGWVRDVLRDPCVAVRIEEVALRGHARVLDPGPEVERARALLLAKYDADPARQLGYWIRSGQPVRVELSGRGARSAPQGR